MSTPVTLKEEKFLALPKEKYSKLLSDDFIHSSNNLVVSKFSSLSNNGVAVNYKVTCTLNENNENQKDLKLSDEIKFGIPYKNYYLTNRKGDLRYHVDLGKYNNSHLYAQVKQNFNFQYFWLRFGAFNIGKNHHIGVRAERDSNSVPMVSFRSIYNYNQLKAAFVGIFNLQDMNFKKNDLSLTYGYKDSQFCLQHFASKLGGLGKISVGAHHSLNNKKQVGIELVKDFGKDDSQLEAQIGIQAQCNDKLVSKSKINHQGKLQVSTKYNLEKNLNLTGSLEINLSKGLNAFDFSKIHVIPFAVQFDWNY